VRNDTGVFEGGEISMFYDPMIAKLCTWGADRATALEAMRVALDSFEVEGIGHNLPFLSAVMDHPRFISGEITTAFIAEEYPEGFDGVALPRPMRGAWRRRPRRCTGWRRSGAPASPAGWTTTSAAWAPNGS
jgi:propionyl-CoA carboxylase alpha chain